MHIEPLPSDILDRLAEHRTVGNAPRAELEWLVAHGALRRVAAGEHLASKGTPVEETGVGLEIVLTGGLGTWVDHGAGRRRVTEWLAGDITGVLPFSRMTAMMGDTVADTDLEALSVLPHHFPELIRECPTVTRFCVHVMVDRARVFNTNAWQDEKMASLGKLAAGLAHELNNPAAAVARNGKLLHRSIDEVDRAASAVALEDVSATQLAAIERVRRACARPTAAESVSPLERADREDEIAAWLRAHGADDSTVEPLADSAVGMDELNELAQVLEGETLDAALDWVAAGSAIRTLAGETERAGTRISELVEAMKRLTHMDRAPVPEPLDIEQGLRDTMAILTHKARAKSITVRIDLAPGMPLVHAIGGELNQVWVNLLENALDAVDLGGHVLVTAKPEGRSVIIRFIDDGPGIPPEIRNRIFDPFFTTKQPGQGTGLGLEVARARVRGHGGDIDFDSRPGRTEVRVLLPLREDTRPPMLAAT
jgi:signal transduction histidine kinase